MFKAETCKLQTFIASSINASAELFDNTRTALPKLRGVRYDVKVKVVTHPQTQDLQLAKVLQALSDPVRLRLIHMLAAEKDLSCSALCLGRPKSSMSHHFKAMIDAGLLRVDVVGNVHLNNLRLDDLETRFPGLLPAVLQASDEIAQDATGTRKLGSDKRAKGQAGEVRIPLLKRSIKL